MIRSVARNTQVEPKGPTTTCPRYHRQGVAPQVGVGAGHHPAENRSYTALADATGSPLDGSRPLMLRFPAAGTPPCDGFWSLTVYGTDMFLIANEIDRYSIGDRTPGLRPDADGGLTIIIGAHCPPDTSNWLPAPLGPYRMGLRVYEGHPEVVNAMWFPPPLVRVTAERSTS